MADSKKKSGQLKRPVESSESEDESTSNKFANDGSFLEMFKKMQQQKANNKNDNNILTAKTEKAHEPKSSVETKPTEAKRKPKVLKVGIIKKKKNIDDPEEDEDKKEGSAWDHYMKEVRKYKEKFGDDDSDKNRPLVK